MNNSTIMIIIITISIIIIHKGIPKIVSCGYADDGSIQFSQPTTHLMLSNANAYVHTIYPSRFERNQNRIGSISITVLCSYAVT